jgi:hypothetical protein
MSRIFSDVNLNGLRLIDGVPIVDSVMAAVKFVEILVDMKNAEQPWISRKLLYHTPSRDFV